jgi:16S rRNA (cytidine1402-2'-O)-methyltransferase
MLALSAVTPSSEKGKTGLASEVAAVMKSDGISEMDALKRVARERGIGKSEAYRELQREQNRLR